MVHRFDLNGRQVGNLRTRRDHGTCIQGRPNAAVTNPEVDRTASKGRGRAFRVRPRGFRRWLFYASSACQIWSGRDTKRQLRPRAASRHLKTKAGHGHYVRRDGCQVCGISRAVSQQG